MQLQACLKFLPNKSYNKYSFLFLSLFVLIGIVVIGVATDFHSKATLQCNPDETLASDLSTRKYIETQCLRKYVQEFYHSLPLHTLFMINFGLVLLFNIVYAYWLKDRVEIFADPPSTATNGGEEESQPMLGISRAASDPKACRNPSGRIIFTVYIVHLIFCRIIPLVAFATFLLTSSNFPVQYDCPCPKQATSTSAHGTFAQNQSMDISTVDCTYLMGSNKEKLADAVTTINLFFGAVALIELAYLLWSAWRDPDLLIDLEFCCVYLLKKRKRIRKLMKKIRENIPDEIFSLHDDFGEKCLSRRKLEEIYVNVIIQEGRESGCRVWFENKQEIYKIHFKAPANSTTLTKMADLFEPTGVSQDVSRPRTILVVGRPGIGKTLLTKKLLYQWKEQISKFWHNKIVILIRFRAFNKGLTSLRDMLGNSDGLSASLADLNYIYEYVCLMPSNVILIFDGLDELKVNEESLAHSNLIKSPNEVSHIFTIFRQLVKGELLRGVTLLTTSRPTGEHIYRTLEFDREIEILGFHEEQIKDYVEKFCRHDNQKASEIWNLIKESPELLSLCYVPVNSYIVCLTLKESIEVTGLSNVPTTITELYKRAIKILLFKHHSEYKDKQRPKNYIIGKLPKPLQDDLSKLKQIARNGMIEDQLIFEFENDDESVSELSDCGLFNKLEDKRQDIFCFLHLTIQEFLAALHVVDDLKNVESFLSEHINNPKWYLVIQFVAGLIGDKMRELKAQTLRNKVQRSPMFTSNEATPDLAKNEEIIHCICKRFQDLMTKEGRIDGRNNASLVIKCVHEMQEESVMKLIASRWDDDGEEVCLDRLDIAPTESTAFVEFLSCMKNLHKLKLTNCMMECLAFREFTKLLMKESENCQLTALLLIKNNLTDENAKSLSNALLSDKCKLTELDVGDNNLTDEGAKHLSDALMSEKCKLTKLNIERNKLGDKSAKCLSIAMTSDKCKLTDLNLGVSSLTDEGVKHLSAALMSDKCKLTALNIRSSNLTDEGPKHLSDALMSENCKLTKLDISHNNLSDKCVKHLSDALMSDNCKLAKLYIGQNKLVDEGVERLSAALMSENCKLTKLDISNNNLPGKCVKHLSDALMSDNCKLAKLYIGRNKLVDEDVERLSAALMSEKCKLTTLYINHNNLTNKCAKLLSDALRSDECKLVKLDISNNNLAETGAKYLREALINEKCTLTELDLNGNNLLSKRDAPHCNLRRFKATLNLHDSQFGQNFENLTLGR